MFLLFGTRAHRAVINVVSFVCGYCGVLAQQQVVKKSTKFTLFFVPLFPLAKSYANECTNCGGTTRLTATQVGHSMDWAAPHASAG
ncbi:zinc-ribbon domain-containing protein [Cryobacterium sinapicolor]|uniref:Zinc-ribbon domain-containing protein n=1 Tax=Cryobacterium sinapicolor TaxID=1259236 RepID=A0ABY2JBV5_9MICO|nr:MULTISPECIES: zinc-ribbon domain-containing protein [Cryobacterium]TFC82721.1 zinc-ribbon domain-containing protein [Cryobacterium sp. TMT3-29-2]TFD02321.1 zinc-ribbon domain-containing protein [Cryobacterium sinapicolor]